MDVQNIEYPYNGLFFKFLFIYLCMYVWLRWVFVAARGLSLVAVSRVYSSLQCAGFSLWWLLLLGARALRHEDSVVVAPVAPRHVGSSRTRA